MLVNSTSATSDRQEGRKSLFNFIEVQNTKGIIMYAFAVNYMDIFGYVTFGVVYAKNLREAWIKASNQSPINAVPKSVAWLLDY